MTAALEHVGQQATWECGICTLVNGPRDEACEACGAPRGATAVLENGGPSAGGDDAKWWLETQRLGPKDKGKGKKLPKFERLRLTGGDGSATQVRHNASFASV